MIDCLRIGDRKRTRIRWCVDDEEGAPPNNDRRTRKIEESDGEMERRKRRRTVMRRVLERGRAGREESGMGRRHKFRASVKRALRGEALASPICQYPEEIRGGTWPEG